jgi:hypothetical protein
MRIVPPALYNMGELDNMRLSLATAISVALAAALFAGCSTSPQSSSALPGTGASGMAPMGFHMSPAKMYQPKGGINPHDLLKLQAEGRIPAPGGREAAEKALRQQLAHQSFHPPKKGGGGTGMWANMTYYDYILGFNTKGTKVTAAIETDPTYSSQYCIEPYGLKVDGSQNVWVGCYEGGSSETPTAQEYSKTGTLEGQYTFSCPNGWGGCDDYFYGYEGYDVAVNSSDVFVDGYGYGYDCVSTEDCTYTYGYMIESWPNGSPSATPNVILMPYETEATWGYVYDTYGMDVDSSGNLWVAFYGYCTSNSEYGYGLLEITNPTSSPTISPVEPCGTYEYGNAVYTSNSGGTLNVLDTDARKIYQYTLPLSTGGSPSNTLGPTAPFGYPSGLGFNSTDKNVVSGDQYDWLNIGTVATNKWHQEKPILVIDSLFGSGYTPSDK